MNLELGIRNLELQMNLVIIANPAAGCGRAYKSVQSYVRRWPHPEWNVRIMTTRSRDHAGLLAQKLLDDPPDLLAVCGGDGTLNEIASRVPHPPFPVALIPAGTANVLARELGIPLNPVRAVQVALERTVRKVDLGKLGTGTRRFLFVAGIGFDAHVVASVRPKLKNTLGMAAYAAAVIGCLRHYSFPKFQVVADGRTFTATSCLACNATNYGGGLLFCPDADMTDGQLDILVIEGERRLRLARFLLNAWRGKAETGDWIHRLRARTVQVEGSAGVLVQADGELAGNLPLEISLSRSSFPLVIPSKI
ncbi:MAG: diacylglycerol kinase family protein [Acidobacteriota bacterium]|jgi:YegS/Rv2252/BmrU family lipid kinase